MVEAAAWSSRVAQCCYPKGCAAPGQVPCQCNTQGSLSKLKRTPPQTKINVTSKSPVGDISVVTLIRTDTTLDHSQKAEKVWPCLRCEDAEMCEKISLVGGRCELQCGDSAEKAVKEHKEHRRTQRAQTNSIDELPDGPCSVYFFRLKYTVHVGSQGPRKNSGSHIDASHSRQPLVKGERLVRYEVNAVMLTLGRLLLYFSFSCRRQ